MRSHCRSKLSSTDQNARGLAACAQEQVQKQGVFAANVDFIHRHQLEKPHIEVRARGLSHACMHTHTHIHGRDDCPLVTCHALCCLLGLLTFPAAWPTPAHPT